MLHIVLFVLKLIGIIVAVILGILVLLTGIALFVPVRYRIFAGRGDAGENTAASVRATWLFHLVRAEYTYQEEKGNFSVRILWKTFDEKKTEKNERKDHDEKKIPDDPKASGTGSEKADKADQKNAKKSEPSESSAQIHEKEGSADQKKMERNGGDVPRRTTGWAEKIKCTFQKFYDRINTLKNRTEKLKDFLGDETHRSAFSKIKKEGVRCLGRLRPKRLDIKLEFGFDDPYLTGTALAGLGAAYPFLNGHVSVTPNFERKTLAGRIAASGKIYAVHLAALIWNLLWSREVRQTYRDGKKLGG